MKVSKFGLSSDTSASTKSSIVGRLCSIPVTQKHKEAGLRACVQCTSVSAKDKSLARNWDELVFLFSIFFGTFKTSVQNRALGGKKRAIFKKSLELLKCYFYPKLS